MNLYDLTPRQYADARRRQMVAEYGVSLADAAADYPDTSLVNEWIAALFEAGKRGETLRPVVLDRLFARVEPSFWLLLKWYPAVVPAGYVNPKARKATS